MGQNFKAPQRFPVFPGKIWEFMWFHDFTHPPPGRNRQQLLLAVRCWISTRSFGMAGLLQDLHLHQGQPLSKGYPTWLWHSQFANWKNYHHAIKNGKPSCSPSISIRAINNPWRTVNVITRLGNQLRKSKVCLWLWLLSQSHVLPGHIQFLLFEVEGLRVPCVAPHPKFSIEVYS